MKCQEGEKLLAYALRQLKPGEEKSVGSHVAQCAQCREIVTGYRGVDAVLGEWKPVDPSPWLDARVRYALAMTNAQEPSRLWAWIEGVYWWAPARAGALLILVAAVSLTAVRVHNSWVTSGRSGPVQTTSQPRSAAIQAAEDDLALYQDLPVLEDYDMLNNFDLLSELGKRGSKVAE